MYARVRVIVILRWTATDNPYPIVSRRQLVRNNCNLPKLDILKSNTVFDWVLIMELKRVSNPRLER